MLLLFVYRDVTVHVGILVSYVGWRAVGILREVDVVIIVVAGVVAVCGVAVTMHVYIVCGVDDTYIVFGIIVVACVIAVAVIVVWGC